MDGLDLQKLKLPGKAVPQQSEEPTPERRIASRRKSHQFLKGPVPLPWLMVAAQLPGKALAVGIALWFRSGLERSPTVSLPSTLLGLFGVDRHAKARALKALEEAALVAVERGNGKNPIVTILETPEAL